MHGIHARIALAGILTLAATVLVLAIPAQAVEPSIAGLDSNHLYYVSGTDGLWHQIDQQLAEELGYNLGSATRYSSDLPGPIGEPIGEGVGAIPPTSPVIQVPTFSVLPTIGTPRLSPAKPIAGKPFTMTFRVVDQSGIPVKTASLVSFVPTINGRIVHPHSEQFTNGIARLTMTAPATAKGKALNVTLTVKTADEETTRGALVHLG